MAIKTRIPHYPIWNAVFFQSVWFAAVLWGNVAALLSVLCFCCIHFLCVENGQQKKKDLSLVLLLVAIGFWVDTCLGLLGVMQWSSQSIFPMPWLSALWLGFALTVYYGLGWIAHFPRWGVLLGAVCGCASYIGGAHLSPYVSIDVGVYSVAILSGVWALVFAFIWLFLPSHLDVLCESRQ